MYKSNRISNILVILKKKLYLERAFSVDKNVVKSLANDVDIPTNLLLHDYLMEKIAKYPDNKVALECAETKRAVTYQDLRKKSRTFANFLHHSLKLSPKTTVAILLPNIPEYPILLLGAFVAGLNVTTINPNYTPHEIEKQLIHSNSKALFTLAEMDTHINTIKEKLKIPVISLKLKENQSLPAGNVNFHEVANKIDSGILDDNFTMETKPDDVVLTPFSSGTTGNSKGVELTHKNMIANLEQMAAKEFTKIVDDEVILGFLPFFHIYGLVYTLFHVLCEGQKVISFAKFSSQAFINSLRYYRPTIIPGAPPVVHLMNNSPAIKPEEDFVSLKLVMSGAAPLGAADVERLRSITKGRVDVLQCYGMTELSPLAVMQTKALKGGIKLGGSGLIVSNTEYKIVSLDDGASENGLPPHESGQLYIRGPQVMKGYFNNPEATKDTITESGWLKTGDIGHRDEDDHIFITDRLKELIKVQGFQVAPAELEAIIRNHPSVEDVAVVGVEHEKLGEAPKAFVVTKHNSKVQPQELQEFLALKVAKFKQLVGGVVFLDAIPRTTSGKILRRDLKKL